MVRKRGIMPLVQGFRDCAALWYSDTLWSPCWADLTEEPKETQYENMVQMGETVAEDTGGAESLVNSGPTSQSASRTLERLLFPCGFEPPCGECYPLSRLQPVMLEGRLRDVCYACARSVNPKLSVKQFRLKTLQLRACEEAAVSLTEEMKYLPVESLIFNEFRRLKRYGTRSQQDVLRRIGEKGFIKMCRDAIRHNILPTDEERNLMVSRAKHDILDLVQSARKRFGEARLTTASAAAEFMRMLFGDERTVIRAGGGYFCEECMTQTKYDYYWTKATGTGSLSGWFCGVCGHPYDTSRMAGVLTYADVQNAKNSFIIRCRMPSRTVANFRTAIALANLIRHQDCAVSDADVARAGNLGAAFREAIGCDNNRYFRSFDKLREVLCGRTLTRPNLLDKNLPHFKICDGPGDVTLREKDYGRACIAYDLKKLFPVGDGEQAELDDGPWKAILQAVIGAWGVADAAAVFPEKLNELSGCSIKTVKNLRSWTFLRATQHYPPDEHGGALVRGSAADLAWAAKPFEF